MSSIAEIELQSQLKWLVFETSETPLVFESY